MLITPQTRCPDRASCRWLRRIPRGSRAHHSPHILSARQSPQSQGKPELGASVDEGCRAELGIWGRRTLPPDWISAQASQVGATPDSERSCLSLFILVSLHTALSYASTSPPLPAFAEQPAAAVHALIPQTGIPVEPLGPLMLPSRISTAIAQPAPTFRLLSHVHNTTLPCPGTATAPRSGKSSCLPTTSLRRTRGLIGFAAAFPSSPC
ncbi:hypothetical protein B0I37DRAFT_142353 [Chaetomium sp. MPI-CAGE-AT-0009]|nr:hypothetical protein B0I37DRAFT_142353 [Chaetomium sp. MPI-CAGE-AT-0009]